MYTLFSEGHNDAQFLEGKGGGTNRQLINEKCLFHSKQAAATQGTRTQLENFENLKCIR